MPESGKPRKGKQTSLIQFRIRFCCNLAHLVSKLVDINLVLLGNQTNKQKQQQTKKKQKTNKQTHKNKKPCSRSFNQKSIDHADCQTLC